MNTSLLGCTKNDSNLNNVEFSSSSAPGGEAEEGGLLLVALHLELDERRRVTLDRLGHLALNAVQLHRSDHSGIRDVKFCVGKTPKDKNLFCWADIPMRRSQFWAASVL